MMRQAYGSSKHRNQKRYFVRPFSVVRALFLCVLFQGSIWTAYAGAVGSQSHMHASVVTSTEKFSHTMPTLANPDTTISWKPTDTSGSAFNVGDSLTYYGKVCNVRTAGPVTTPDSIAVTISIPMGWENITASGTDWTIEPLSNTISPVEIQATYIGSYPLPTGRCLGSDLIVSGDLTADAAPDFTTSATVTTTDDQNSLNDTSNYTIEVTLPPTPTPTPTPTVEPTAIPTVEPTAIPTVEPTAIPTVEPTAIPTVEPTPIPTAEPTPIPTAEPTPAPTAEPTAEPTAIPTPIPTPIDLSISLTHQGGNTINVGQLLTYNVVVCNVGSTAITTPDSISVKVIVPLGMTAVNATGSGWSSEISATSSPAAVVATYTGLYPLNVHESLPPLMITGTLTNDVPVLTSTATVTTSGDLNPDNDVATDSTIVHPIALSTPDMGIAVTNTGGARFFDDQSVTYTLLATDNTTSAPVTKPASIVLTYEIPIGLQDISLQIGPAWSYSLDATQGPTFLKATYIGAYPIASGAQLPTIYVTGQLTSDAVPVLITRATITTSGDSNTTNDASEDIIFVLPHYQQCNLQPSAHRSPHMKSCLRNF